MGATREPLFSDQELAVFRAFAAEQSEKAQADLAEALQNRKLTLARSDHFRLVLAAAKLFDQLGDPALAPDRRSALWAELGKPSPTDLRIGPQALQAAAQSHAARRKKPSKASATTKSRSQRARQTAVRLHLESGASIRELAKRFGVSSETIRLWVRKHQEHQDGYRAAPHPRVPEEVKIEAARLVVTGAHTAAQLAEKHGCHPTTVGRWVREYRASMDIPKPHRRLVPEEVRRATLRLIFEEGLAPAIAARQTGVSGNTALHWAERHKAELGIAIPEYRRGRRGGHPPGSKATAIRLVFTEGRLVTEAALVLDIPVATIRRWAQEHQRETGAAMPGLAAITAQTRDQAAQAHFEFGVPVETIARQLQVTARTVKTWMYTYAPGKEVPLAPGPKSRRPRKSG